MDISKVLIAPKALEYIQKRQLEKQYLKAKKYILWWYISSTSLKLREPKSDEIWYFRINKQYRALCKLEWDILYVLAIDNHQN